MGARSLQPTDPYGWDFTDRDPDNVRCAPAGRELAGCARRVAACTASLCDLVARMRPWGRLRSVM